MKFRTAKRTHVLLGCANFKESVQRVDPAGRENADFLPLSKFNTGSFSLRGKY